MSTSLYYRVIPDGKDLSDDLKYKVREAFQLPRTFDKTDLPFLIALNLCGIKDSHKLIELIKKHGEVELFEK